MPDLRRQDAAVGAATTVWLARSAYVLPLTVALPAIQGARFCSEGSRYPRLSWLDEPRSHDL